VTEFPLSVPETGKRPLPLPIAAWAIGCSCTASSSDASTGAAVSTGGASQRTRVAYHGWVNRSKNPKRAREETRAGRIVSPVSPRL
jgi:hypothetical protein